MAPMSYTTNPIVPIQTLNRLLFKLLLTDLLLLASRTHSKVTESKTDGRQINQKATVIIRESDDKDSNENKD